MNAIQMISAVRRLVLLGGLSALLAFLGPQAMADSVRAKDLGRLDGWRDNVLVGTGIVTGLAGTGDSANNRATKQALANAMSQFNLSIPVEQMQSRNVAIVMVSASISAFARPGDTIDVTVTSAGDSRSLVGGSLLLTPLKAVNGKIYALAQGALQVGGFRYDANGNIVQKNHPTVGLIPSGGIVELGVASKSPNDQQSALFILNQPDYTTATRLADAFNAHVGQTIATASDASTVEISIPERERGRMVSFLSRLESVTVAPDRRARVVINERTGTVVAGGDVRVSKVSIAHGDLRITVSEVNAVSQPGLTISSSGVGSVPFSNTQVSVDESPASNHVTGSGTVADLVGSLSKMRMSTRDIISVLRAVKSAGALHAELIVQ